MENCFNEVVSLDTTMNNEKLLETSELSVTKEITQQEIQGPKTLAFLKDQLIASVMTPYPCPICKKGLSSKSALRSHSDSVHERKKPHLCPSCGKIFAKKGQLKVHYDLVHEGIKAFKCLDCNACFAFKKSLKNHKANKCAKTLVAVNDENKPFKCSLCYMNFSSKKTIRQHIFNVHEGKKPNKVHRVKENESDRNIFAVHKEKESVIVKTYGKSDKCVLSIEKKPFSCGIRNKTFDKKCDFSIDSELELTKHITSVHCGKVIQAKERSFKCPKCNFKTKKQHNFDMHIKSKKSHLQRKQRIRQSSLKCPDCTFEATTQHNLDVHIKGKGKTAQFT